VAQRRLRESLRAADGLLPDRGLQVKTLAAGMTTHLAQEVSTLCVCWKITAQGGTVLGFTSHIANLTISGQLYKSSTGFTPSAVSGTASFSVDNMNVDGLISADFTVADLLAGKWDFATVEIFLVNYLDLTLGSVKIRKGTLGAVTMGRQQFQAEIRGMLQAYSRSIVELYSPSCRADLGDARCLVTLATYTVTGLVTSFTNSRVFFDSARAEANAYFDGGLLTWTGGLNSGRTMEVKAYLLAGGAFQLVQPMVSAIALGDTYSVSAGCDKQLATCRDKFSNLVHFRGEPHVPQGAGVSISTMAGGGGGMWR
jgi:uncharacterized phage protein (TIGR02218 family)